MVTNPPASVGDARAWVPSLGQEDFLEQETATCSRILAWKTPWTEGPDRQSPWDCEELNTTDHSNIIPVL